MSDWKPVEPTMVDGTEAIVFCPFDGISTAKWDATRRMWIGFSFDGEALDENGKPHVSSMVTHWMPLPNPPK